MLKGEKMSDPQEMSQEQVVQLSSQVNELNQKIDKLNAKLEKSEATNSTILEQQKQMLNATNNSRSQEIMRQTVSNPTGLIAKEATNYIIRTLEKIKSLRLSSG
jgi:TolA-binding protein